MLAEFELFPPPFLALIEAVSTGGLARTLVLNISPITSTDISVQPGNPRTLGTYAKARPDRNVEVSTHVLKYYPVISFTQQHILGVIK